MKLQNNRQRDSNYNLFTALRAAEKATNSEECFLLVLGTA
jgi:hypothetical protein